MPRHSSGAICWGRRSEPTGNRRRIASTLAVTKKTAPYFVGEGRRGGDVIFQQSQIHGQSGRPLHSRPSSWQLACTLTSATTYWRHPRHHWRQACFGGQPASANPARFSCSWFTMTVPLYCSHLLTMHTCIWVLNKRKRKGAPADARLLPVSAQRRTRNPSCRQYRSRKDVS